MTCKVCNGPTYLSKKTMLNHWTVLISTISTLRDVIKARNPNHTWLSNIPTKTRRPNSPTNPSGVIHI